MDIEPSDKELSRIEKEIERSGFLEDDSIFEIEEDDFEDDGHFLGLGYFDDFED